MRKRKTGEQTFSAAPLLDRPFWRFFSAVGDFFVLTVFWVFTSLPLVTLGASTSALFYVFLKKRSHEEGTLWGMYKKSFMENLRQASFLWLLYVFAALDAGIILYIMTSKGLLNRADFLAGGRYCPVLIAAGLVYFSVMLYTAALLARFRQTNGQCVLSAFCLALRHIFSTLLFLAILAVLAFLTYYFLPPLIFIDVPLAVMLISIRMDSIFQEQIRRVQQRG